MKCPTPRSCARPRISARACTSPFCAMAPTSLYRSLSPGQGAHVQPAGRRALAQGVFPHNALQAAAVAARALRAVAVDGIMAELGGHRPRAAQHLAVRKQAGAHALRHVDIGEIWFLNACKHAFGIGKAGGVVQKAYRVTLPAPGSGARPPGPQTPRQLPWKGCARARHPQCRG